MTARTLPPATVTVTVEDMMLDLLCFEYAFARLGDRALAGKLSGYVEATLAANQDHARQGTLLQLGAVIHLPEFVIETAAPPVVRLWDE